MAQNDGVYVFQDPNANRSNGFCDIAALAALGNGGFGGMNNPLWMMFMYPFILPFMSMYGNGFGGFGGFGGNAGAGYVANQLNNDVGRDLIVQAINGRADALGQLAQITNSNIDEVRSAINLVSSKLCDFGAQLGMSGLQVINEVQSGNANIAKQLCECCCENRLAIANQTNAIQAQVAANHAATQLQIAQNEATSQLSVCQQTNQLGSQADRNTNTVLNAIANQNTMITKEFCDLKERELQNKINTQSDIITQLRGQISNDAQSRQFMEGLRALDDKIDAIAAKQPNTVPVQYPNLVAANATPFVGGISCAQSYYPQNNFWN